jgi:hypothetical protein
MTLKNLFRLISRLIMGSKLYEKVQFKRHTGYKGNFESPKTFNEFLCRRKLNKSFKEAVLFQDKYAVREYVKSTIGEEYLTKLYQVIENPSQLDYQSLPKAFVVKGTNACGTDSLLIVSDKTTISEEKLRSKVDFILKRHLNIFKRFYFYSNEWWYNEIPVKVLIEEHLMADTGEIPLDYKFFVFHGRVEYIQVDFGRFVNHTRSLYNRNWELQDFQLGYPRGIDVEAPKLLGEMIEVAERLAKGYDFLRVDLYEISGKRVVFGEITVCPSLGHARFTPTSWDHRFGELWAKGMV